MLFLLFSIEEVSSLFSKNAAAAAAGLTWFQETGRSVAAAVTAHQTAAMS
jgi:hypothetical protein